MSYKLTATGTREQRIWGLWASDWTFVHLASYAERSWGQKTARKIRGRAVRFDSTCLGFL